MTDAAEVERVQSAWHRITEWTGQHAPSVFSDLNPPATEADIVHAEKLLGVKFPPCFHASLLIHNGQSRDGPGLTPTGCLLSLATMIDEWSIWQGLLDGGEFDSEGGDPRGPVKPHWWSPLWLPITYDGAGNHECLDFDPAEGGRSGQVIQMFHDDAARVVSAESYASWLEAIADGMQRGALQFSEASGAIVRAGDG